MKTYYDVVVEGGDTVTFKDAAKARAYRPNYHDLAGRRVEKKYHVEEYQSVRYYGKLANDGRGGYITLKAKNVETLIALIENNIRSIMENTGARGASGYTLHDVTLTADEKSGIVLTITNWPFSSAEVGYTPKMLNEDTLKVTKITIDGADESDVPNKDYHFELRKSSC